jgi:ribosome-associated translation inhibitor RaiA
MQNNIIIESGGMNPNEETMTFLLDELTASISLAPRNSKVKLKYQMRNNGFEGHIILQASNCAFVATAKEKDLTTLIKSLKKKLKAQMGKWRDAKLDHKSRRVG